MSMLGMPDFAAALPHVSAAPTVKAGVEQATAPQDEAQASAEAGTAKPKNPQEHGWAVKKEYDYSTFMKTSKELAEVDAAAAQESGDGGVEVGGWASNAAVYEWNDEFGDVGPQHAELEKQLFGSETHVRAGIEFGNLTSIDVHQEGNVRITPIRKFEDAGLHPIMLENVKLAGYTVPTPIQQYCMPAVKLGHDIVACAQTGSGKTAAFLVPIISKLMGKAKKLAAPRPNPATYEEGITPQVRAEPLVLIVCPSRELATQIFDEARRFCYRSMLRPCVVYGGGPIREQVRQLQKGCDVLIGTPGRLVDFIGRPEIVTLKRLKYMVIDEADEMLQADWEEELNKIMSGGDQEEGNINYLLFSATFPKSARDLAKQHLAHSHVRIRVGRAGSSHMNIKQDVVFVESSMKRRAVMDLLFATPPARTIIFVNSKRAADELDDFLFNNDFPCVSIHSGRTQREREDCIRAFRLGKSPILIATGVSARGIDIFNVMHVINYDLPSAQYGGIEEYTHRIGRTGRIGNMGLATSFYNERDSDLAENLTKTLLETKQLIPDFLEQFIPDGFAPDGTGDLNKLKFEADSDYGDDEAGGAPVAEAGWGSSAPAASAALGSAPGEALAAADHAAGDWGAADTSAILNTSQPAAANPWGSTTPSVPLPVAPVAPVVQPSPVNQYSQVAPSPQVSQAPQYGQDPRYGQAPHLAQASQLAPSVLYSPGQYPSGSQNPPATRPPVGQWPPQAPVAFIMSGPPAPPDLVPSAIIPAQPAAPFHAGGYNAAPASSQTIQAPTQAAQVPAQAAGSTAPSQESTWSGGWDTTVSGGW